MWVSEHFHVKRCFFFVWINLQGLNVYFYINCLYYFGLMIYLSLTSENVGMFKMKVFTRSDFFLFFFLIGKFSLQFFFYHICPSYFANFYLFCGLIKSGLVYVIDNYTTVHKLTCSCHIFYVC